MSNSIKTWVMAAGAVLLLAAAAVVYLSGTTDAASAQSASAGAAPSVTSSKQCYSVPCHGNAKRETIYERIGDGKRDIIRSYGNYDRIHANTYSKDTDQVYGYGGSDYLYVNDGDSLDTAVGGPGHSRCYVDSKAEAGRGCARVIVR